MTHAQSSAVRMGFEDDRFVLEPRRRGRGAENSPPRLTGGKYDEDNTGCSRRADCLFLRAFLFRLQFLPALIRSGWYAALGWRADCDRRTYRSLGGTGRTSNRVEELQPGGKRHEQGGGVLHPHFHSHQHGGLAPRSCGQGFSGDGHGLEEHHPTHQSAEASRSAGCNGGCGRGGVRRRANTKERKP